MPQATYFYGRKEKTVQKESLIMSIEGGIQLSVVIQKKKFHATLHNKFRSEHYPIYIITDSVKINEKAKIYKTANNLEVTCKRIL